VYVVVADGLTNWLPPLACSVYALPSVPVIFTWVEFAAVTVRVDEAPALIDAGLAEIATVGAVGPALTFEPPHPTKNTGSTKAQSAHE